MTDGQGEAQDDRPGGRAGERAVDREPELSAAVRVASAIGLFLGGAVLAPAMLILLAYAFAAVGADGGWVVYLDFALVGLLGVAALLRARWRPLGIGLLVGGLFAAAVVSFYLVVLQADEDGFHGVGRPPQPLAPAGAAAAFAPSALRTT